MRAVDTRRPLWIDLHTLATSTVDAWCVMGDFTFVPYSGDIMNGNPITLKENKDFEP